MTELLTAAEMRALEQAAIDAGEVTGLELMERAGQGVVDAILAWRPELATAPHRAVILCGPGNNGGDGFVVARLLHERGWDVEVFAMETAERAPDAVTNRQRWEALGAALSLESFMRSTGEAGTIIVDAIFGAGLTRRIEGVVDEAIAAIGGHDAIVSVDAPTGLDLDSGDVLGCAPTTSLTVTFSRAKIGHVLGAAPAICHQLVTVPLGIEDEADPTVSERNFVRRVELRGEEVNAFLARMSLNRRSVGGHKYAYGHALILSGGVGRGGAARLAARGALRVGAGLVTVGCPPAAVIENAGRLDAIMLTPLADAEALTAEIAARKVRAVCLGPGFGTGERLRAFVAAVLAHREVEPQCTGSPGVVLDADALTEYREDPETLFAQLHERCVLTPHEGEFGRLFPDILEKLKAPAVQGPAYSKVDATREAAVRAGCVVLFKGADTVIAAPDGRCAINAAVYERAAPWLATAGSGDVLAGFITGLLARGLGPMQAAETGAWLHVESARQFGPGLIAEDLPEQLPAVFRDLGL